MNIMMLAELGSWLHWEPVVIWKARAALPAMITAPQLNLEFGTVWRVYPWQVSMVIYGLSMGYKLTYSKFDWLCPYFSIY